MLEVYLIKNVYTPNAFENSCFCLLACLFFKAHSGLILFLEEDKVKLTDYSTTAGVLVCIKCKETVATNHILQIQVNSSTDFLHSYVTKVTQTYFAFMALHII